MVTNATVRLWGNTLGYLYLDEQNKRINFQYSDEFGSTGYEVSPILYPFEKGHIYSRLIPRQGEEDCFKGLPEFIADILPDKWGTALVNRWLAENGRDKDSINTIERLLYMGNRGMGALEFITDLRPELSTSIAISELDGLVKIAAEIIENRGRVNTNIKEQDEALKTIISIGSSAGGSRAKAVVSYNRDTGEILSGQVDAPEGFEHYLIKLDGVTNGILGDPGYWGILEYSYYKLALACKINMMECMILKDRERRHFLTKRYDRKGNKKIHKVSLCGIAGMDFNRAGWYSYEQMFSVMRQIGLDKTDAVESFRRMVFNVVGRNQDDHTKNVEFLMNNQGQWSLAPAFDMTYSYAPENRWLAHHQMTINGKKDNFIKEDLLKIAKDIGIKNAEDIIAEIVECFENFEDYMEPGIPEEKISAMKKTLRTDILTRNR